MVAWAALGPFVALVNFFQGLLERRDDRVRAALAPLGKALAETRLYLRDRERGSKRDSKREDELVRLWTSAAAALYAIDSALADICENKSRYWLQQNWSEQEIAERGIAIDDLYDTYGTLLKARETRLDR